MADIIRAIEAADGYVLAAPTNFGSVTALFKRFLERLIVYGYWPWGRSTPKFRKSAATKPAVLVSSSAAPGFLGRWLYGSLKQLKMAARLIGARPVGTLFTGLVADTQSRGLPEPVRRRARKLAASLTAD